MCSMCIDKIRKTNPLGNSKYTSYDSVGRITKEILEDGNLRKYFYDDSENTLLACDATSKKILYLYYGYGTIEIVKDAENDIVLLARSYDDKKRLIGETSALGAVIKYSYDGFDRCLSAVTYDTDGSVLKEKQIAYDDAFCDDYGRVRLKMTVTDGGSMSERVTSYVFDRNQNLTEKILKSDSGDRIYSSRTTLVVYGGNK